MRRESHLEYVQGNGAGDERHGNGLKVAWGFPGGSVVKNPPANTGDRGLTPGSGRPLEKEMATHSGFLAQEVPWAGGAWQATVHEVTKSQT